MPSTIPASKQGALQRLDAGWSSLVARRAHNPKVVGSNPAPATKYSESLFWNKQEKTKDFFAESALYVYIDNNG